MTESEEMNELYGHKYLGQGQFRPAIDLREYVYKVVQLKGPLTRLELKQLTQIPWTTLYDTLIRLVFQGRVRKYAQSLLTRGRPKILYEVTKREVAEGAG